MPSPKVLFYPNTKYHIYNHASGFENMFTKDEHYISFLNRYAFHCSDVFSTYAWALMPNHFHFVVSIKSLEAINDRIFKRKGISYKINAMDENYEVNFSNYVSRVFSTFLGSYVQYYNKNMKRKGNLVRQNSKRKIIIDDAYFKQSIKYLHWNPVKHEFCNNPREYAFTSYYDYLNRDSSLIKFKPVIKLFGGYKKFLRSHEDENILNFEIEK
ncbi:MAG: hypothetical protein AAGK97_12830 [Bacteroidota bacterium]